MSRTENTPRGAVRGTPPRAADAAVPPDAALADRFRRVLGAPRRDAATWVRDEQPPDTPALGTLLTALPGVPGVPDALQDEGQAPPRAPAACAPDTDDATQTPPEPAQPDPPPPPASAPLPEPWAWRRQGGNDRGAQDREAPPGEPASAIDAAPEPAWLRDTADFVGSLCAGIDAGFQTWRMTVPLDARQLPETQLELSLSPHTLCLRFRAASPESARLVLRYRQQLLDLLSQVPALPSHIDIELD
jgi:type III secretion control protein HpaP